MQITNNIFLANYRVIYECISGYIYIISKCFENLFYLIYTLKYPYLFLHRSKEKKKEKDINLFSKHINMLQSTNYMHTMIVSMYLLSSQCF